MTSGRNGARRRWVCMTRPIAERTTPCQREREAQYISVDSLEKLEYKEGHPKRGFLAEDHGMSEPRPQKADASGQGMTEYIIVVALIVIAAIGVFSLFGPQIKELLSGGPQGAAESTRAERNAPMLPGPEAPPEAPTTQRPAPPSPAPSSPPPISPPAPRAAPAPGAAPLRPVETTPTPTAGAATPRPMVPPREPSRAQEPPARPAAPVSPRQ